MSTVVFYEVDRFLARNYLPMNYVVFLQTNKHIDAERDYGLDAIHKQGLPLLLADYCVGTSYL